MDSKFFETNKTKTDEDFINLKDKFDSSNLDVILSNYLLQENISRSEKYSKTKSEIRFYPSSVGKCMRQNVYQMLGYIGIVDNPQNLTVLENGNYFHLRMEKLFEQMGILIAPELSIRDAELNISGRSDAIIWNPKYESGDDPGEDIVLIGGDYKVAYEGKANLVSIVEFKSIKDSKFHKLSKKKPLPEHEKQLQLYFALTGINNGYIYYENKNSQATKIYEVYRNEEIIEEVIKEIKETIGYAERGELPERPFNASDIQCRFCNFRNICFPNTNPYSFSDIFKDIEEEEKE